MNNLSYMQSLGEGSELNFQLLTYLPIFFSETYSVVRDCMDVFAHVSMCASVLMIVALTCERHFAIDSPHQVS